MGFEADITQALGSTGNQTQIILGEKPRFKGRRLVDVTEPIQVTRTVMYRVAISRNTSLPYQA